MLILDALHTMMIGMKILTPVLPVASGNPEYEECNLLGCYALWLL
jgi:hypothetical protein